jgi:hypothetical protein
MAASGRETGRSSFVNGSELRTWRRGMSSLAESLAAAAPTTPALAKAITGERRDLAVTVGDRRKTHPAVMCGTLAG